ncbi:MAG: DnaJ domain-containing protein [Alphaproteobacteria bacterium]|nr:DnaJ domain-containing protein [Alphaproteobacteria bacterium]
MAKKSICYDSLQYYQILKVSPEVSEDDLRVKYRELVKLWHPDHNKNPEAINIFQKISQAYDVLKNPQSRLKYDLLSTIYNSSNFPNMDALIVLRNMHGQEDLNIRAFRLIEITGKGITHSKIEKIYYCSIFEAASVVSQITKHNWMYGFLGITAFFANIKAIFSNIFNINSKKDNYNMALHNAIAYDAMGKKEEALTSLYIAKSYASNDELCYVNKYISTFENTSLLAVKNWNFSKLKRIQLFYPLVLLLLVFFGVIGFYLKGIENNRKNATNLKEVVVFGDGSKTFSDVSVAKIFDIPVNVYDKERLYYVKEDTNAMHGADEAFDVYGKIEAGTTVRITGQTADNKWLRVMFDNGEMAFIKASKLEKGIGKEIPIWSKIYKEN